MRQYAIFVSFVAALASGCNCSPNPAGDGDAGAGGMGGAGGGDQDAGWQGNDAGTIVVVDGGVTLTDDAGTFTCYITQCVGKVLACGNCSDDDSDGLIDWRDQECLGPCDNTEGPALNAGVGGETGGKCKSDCYFDFGNGSGNDDCYWDHQCDPLAVAPAYPPEGPVCPYTPALVGGRDCPATQSSMCLNYCPTVTPNGCDCFGCCTFPSLAAGGADGGAGYVWLGALNSAGEGTCTFAKITDPTACPPCTPVRSCQNSCGKCEVCVGKPQPDPSCFTTDGGTTPDAGESQCPSGAQPCGLAGQALCAQDFYCVTGCCVFVPIN